VKEMLAVQKKTGEVEEKHVEVQVVNDWCREKLTRCREIDLEVRKNTRLGMMKIETLDNVHLRRTDAMYMNVHEVIDQSITPAVERQLRELHARTSARIAALREDQKVELARWDLAPTVAPRSDQVYTFNCAAIAHSCTNRQSNTLTCRIRKKKKFK
jgi:hypothetical protein